MEEKSKRKMLVVASALGSVLSADVFARYCRGRGYDVLFVGGEEDSDRRCHKPLFDWFDISFDVFSSTMTPETTNLSHQVFHNLHQNGAVIPCFDDLHYYCPHCHRFLSPAQVQGQCRRCSNSIADDDATQCCPFMSLDILRNPRCRACQKLSMPVHRGRQLFLRMPSEYLEEQPCCLTKDLSFSDVPLPLREFKHKALLPSFIKALGYISLTKSHISDWEQWWKNPGKVELHQFVVKELVPLYAVHFPSMLIGTRESWTLPSSIYSTKSLLFETEEFAESLYVGFFDDDVKQTGLPAEVWRYYLLSNRPEVSDDTMFSWEDLQVKLNSELADNLGNLIYSVLAVVADPPGNGYGSIIPCASGAVVEQLDVDLVETIYVCVQKYINALEKGRMEQGLEASMEIAHAGNLYFQNNRIRELYKTHSLRCSFVVKTLVGVVGILACLLEPFMPSFTGKVLEQLNLPLAEISVLYDVDRVQKPWMSFPVVIKLGRQCHCSRNREVEQCNPLKKCGPLSILRSCSSATQRKTDDNDDLLSKQSDEKGKDSGSGASTCGASSSLRRCSLEGEPEGDGDDNPTSNRPDNKGKDRGSQTSSLRSCSTVGQPKRDGDDKKGKGTGSRMSGTKALKSRFSGSRRKENMDGFAITSPKKRKLQYIQIPPESVNKRRAVDGGRDLIPPKSVNKWRAVDGGRDFLDMLQQFGTVTRNLSTRAENLYYKEAPLSKIFRSLGPNRIFTNYADCSSVRVTMSLRSQQVFISRVQEGLPRWTPSRRV